MNTQSTKLFQGFSLKALQLPNRIVMAPMTRLRAHDDGEPSSPMAEYYAQRASAGLIVSECTMVSPLSHGYMHAPGIFTEKQAKSWAVVTEKVHASNGRIFLQLWHSGRVSHPNLLEGKQPVAPSSIAGIGDLHTPKGKENLAVPRQLELHEIADIVEQFRASAKLALAANFDGVEIHGAFGYLIDQFLQDISNKREDSYGGSIENRTRFMYEIAEAVSSIFPGKTGIKLSPSNTFYGMGDSNPEALFTHALERLNSLDLAYVHLMEPNPADIEAGAIIKNVAEKFRQCCKHVLITNGGYDRHRAEEILEKGSADLVSFGRPFIGNPDFVYRLANELELTEANPSTFYGRGPDSVQGYTDYAVHSERAKQMAE